MPLEAWVRVRMLILPLVKHGPGEGASTSAALLSCPPGLLLRLLVPPWERTSFRLPRQVLSLPSLPLPLRCRQGTSSQSQWASEPGAHTVYSPRQVFLAPAWQAGHAVTCLLSSLLAGSEGSQRCRQAGALPSERQKMGFSVAPFPQGLSSAPLCQKGWYSWGGEGCPSRVGSMKSLGLWLSALLPCLSLSPVATPS